MHDSLDLTELKNEARNFANTYAWYKTLGRLFFAVMVLSVISILLPVRTEPISSPVFVIRIFILFALVILASIGFALFLRAFIMSIRRSSIQVERINKFAPEFVPRITKGSIFRSWVWIAIAIMFVVMLIFPDQGFKFILVTLISCLLAWNVYRTTILRFWGSHTAWVHKLVIWLPKGPSIRTSIAGHLSRTGAFNDAESIYRELLAQYPKSSALLLNNLGYWLTLNGRYPEALPILVAAIRIEPGFANSYDSLAEWYLCQNIGTERALELCEVAVEIAPALSRGSRAIQYATYARTLALNERSNRARATMRLALRTINKVDPSTAAEVNRQLGYAHLALGDEATARTHFTRASQLDPTGLYGQLAQCGLASLSASPTT